MRHERLFLCAGVSKPKQVGYPAKTKIIPLQLLGRGANITLKISDIQQKLVANLPELYTDLLEIATYVYCADQAAPRGGSGARDRGAKWRRNMYFVVPVRKPDFWSNQKVKNVLETLLHFLSDDNYDFRFTELQHPPRVDAYFEFPGEEIGFQADDILSFSGGPDSLGGAIQETFVDGRRIALVSHRSAPKIAPKQKRLHAEICNRCPQDVKPMHIPVWIRKHGWEARDNSQLTRSCLYASLSATIASMFGKDKIRFYENGITSLNLPICEQVLGARATRTTHAQSVSGFRELFSLVNDRDFEVETPFLWKTKTDVVELIRNAGQADLMKHAVSCSRIWQMTRLKTHCGCCSQCIDRRLAVFASDCVEHDPDEMYKTDVFIGQRSEETQDVVLAESYIRSMRECSEMTESQFFSKYGELARVVPYIKGKSDDVAGKLFRLFLHNSTQVKNAIAKAVRYYADQLVDEVLPNRCLLRQLFGTKTPRVEVQLPGDELVTLTRVADLLNVDKGTVSRYADRGVILDNGLKGLERRVWKSSVLLLKQQREDQELLRDAQELRKDSQKLPNKH